MKVFTAVLVAVGVGLSPGMVSARVSGAVSHAPPSLTVGGALGARPDMPGTNSLGTALPTDLGSSIPMKGPLLGTSPAIDQENARVDRMIGSICRGC